MSSASDERLMLAMRRMHIGIVHGGLFIQSNEPAADDVERFSWLVNTYKNEEEVKGYSAAMTWMQHNLCPEGVIAVIKS